MLRINRLRIEINTVNGIYGIDEHFKDGLNFVSSIDNTCGKSSILAAIYYCLGFEQILGGVSGIGSKVLTSAFKNTIEDNGKSWSVTESGAYLEISNGLEVITVYRTIKTENKDNRLITVFYGEYNSLGNPEIQSEDFYVNIQNAATSSRGFHSFLENFLHLELPLVRTSDGIERKLYLQLIFSAMFIEQKHGWSDILSGMPIFGIRESKKRVLEYIIGLDTLKNEKEHERLNGIKTEIENEWKKLIQQIQATVYLNSCNIINLPIHPRVLSDKEYSRIVIFTETDLTIEARSEQLSAEYESLCQLKPRVTDNFEAISKELSETEATILDFEEKLKILTQKLFSLNQIINQLNSNIQLICADIRNNEDAARLQKFGSEHATEQISVNVCPTCKQQIKDNLLEANVCSGFMSIEENIRHLKAQKSMLVFSLNGRKNTRDEIRKQKQDYESRLLTLRRLAHTLRSDLYTTTDAEASEAIMLKKIEITQKIEQLSQLKNDLATFLESLRDLSDRWNTYLDQKSKLPKKGVPKSDIDKVELLKTYFINNLSRYHYSSLPSLAEIEISKESLLPTVDGFDMKFDSSASDGIRMIWAFTMALLQVSIKKDGNHPGVIIFDEPAQQSIVPEDMRSFIHSATEIGSKCQIIMAITLNSKELIQIINDLDSEKYHKISITEKAFKHFEI